MTVEPGSLQPGIDQAELERLIAESVARALAPTDRQVDAAVAQNEVTAGDLPVASSRAFMVMPFGDEELNDVYELYVKPSLEEGCAVECVRGDDTLGSNVIMEDVRDEIIAADMVIADLTGLNANVFYEVGFADALGKPVLLITQSVDEVPFDLRHRRVLPYDVTPRGCRVLEEKIAEHTAQMISLR